MPTAAPLAIPAAMLPGGPLNPVDWIDAAGGAPGSSPGVGGALQSSLMRGTPGALAPYQRRQIQGPSTIAQQGPVYLHSRPYDRGAGAFSPKFGTLNINPIGAGVYAPYKLPVSGGPGARYQMAAIWFDVQTIPTSVQASPTMSMESLDALIATSYVAAMYPTTG
jgi:hypothetical protein